MNPRELHNSTVASFSSSEEGLGQPVEIGGNDCVAVVKHLSTEEARGLDYDQGALGMVALRITVTKDQLDFTPAYDDQMTIDSEVFRVRALVDCKVAWRISLVRYDG